MTSARTALFLAPAICAVALAIVWAWNGYGAVSAEMLLSAFALCG